MAADVWSWTGHGSPVSIARGELERWQDQWRKRSAWPYVARAASAPTGSASTTTTKRERTKSFPSARHAREWMRNYVTAERRGRDSLRRFLLDLDAKEADECGGPHDR